MYSSRLKLWIIITFSLAIIAVVIRAIWQIVVIPTAGTVLVFLPFIAALLVMEAVIIYLVIDPRRFRSRPFALGLTTGLSAGILSGIAHYVRFIVSPEAEPFFSKVIASMVIMASVVGYIVALYVIWSLRKSGSNGQSEV